MTAIIRAGMSNPMVRRVAVEVASNLVYEVGVPLVKSGVRKAYKGVDRRGRGRHH